MRRRGLRRTDRLVRAAALVALALLACACAGSGGGGPASAAGSTHVRTHDPFADAHAAAVRYVRLNAPFFAPGWVTIYGP